MASSSSLNEFASEGFDVVGFTSDIVRQHAGSGGVDTVLEDLCTQLVRVDAVIGAHVSTHSEHLIARVDHVPALRAELEMVLSRVDSLRSSMSKIRRDAVAPFERMAGRIEQLQRMQQQWRKFSRQKNLEKSKKGWHAKMKKRQGWLKR